MLRQCRNIKCHYLKYEDKFAKNNSFQMSPFIMLNANKTRVTGLIGDIWTNLEGILGFKLVYPERNGDIFKMC